MVIQRIGEAFADVAQDSGFHLAPQGTRVMDDDASEEYCPELIVLSPDSEIRAVVEMTDGSRVNEAYGERAQCYRRIPSVEHYVIASADRPQIAWFSRLNERQWLYGVAERSQSEAHLSSMHVTLRLSEIYEGVFTADTQSA